MDDLTKQWNCLSLSEREGDDLCIKKDRQSQEHIIAALFFTRRVLSTEAVARTFKPLWRAERGFIDFITSLKTHQQWKKTQKKEWNDVNLCIFLFIIKLHCSVHYIV